MATLIRYKATGHTRLVADFSARTLIARGIATAVDATPTYKTRQMVPAAPAVAINSSPLTTSDPLGDMGPDELRALAQTRGLKVHHKAGPDKLRAALREAEG
jgi:hypothetical protein